MRWIVLLCAASGAAACADRAPGLPEQQSAEQLQPDPRMSPQRLRLMDEARPLGRAARKDPGFSDMWFEHEPRFRVVLAFTDGRPRPELLAPLSPELRSHLDLRVAKRSRSRVGRDMDAIIAALKGSGIEYTAAYSPRTQRFEVIVGAPAAADTVRRRLPESLRADTDVRVGSLPVQLARPG